MFIVQATGVLEYTRLGMLVSNKGSNLFNMFVSKEENKGL